MEKKLRFIHVMASSDLGTRLQLTLSADTDDLIELISVAVAEITQYGSSSGEKFRIEHIDSIRRLSDPDK